MNRKFPCVKIAENTWEISEFGDVSAFLLEGDDKALLIDTGVGIGNIRAAAEALTDKPLEVFITHNHRDHMGGAAHFDKIRLSREDSFIGPLIYTPATRLIYANNTLKINHPDWPLWTEADLPAFTESDVPEVEFIADGDVIDLGSRRLTAVRCPGHSPGSMSLIDDSTGMLFSGDCVNENVGLGVRSIPNIVHSSMEDALAALRRLWAMDFDRARIFPAHTSATCRAVGSPLPVHIFPRVLELMESIIADRCEISDFYIKNIDTTVSKAYLEDVSIEFQRSQIHGRDTFRVLSDKPVTSTY